MQRGDGPSTGKFFGKCGDKRIAGEAGVIVRLNHSCEIPSSIGMLRDPTGYG
jgi:hypothetical protein